MDALVWAPLATNRDPHVPLYQFFSLHKVSKLAADQTHSLRTRVSSTSLSVSGCQITQKDLHFKVPKSTQKNYSDPKRIKKYQEEPNKHYNVGSF